MLRQCGERHRRRQRTVIDQLLCVAFNKCILTIEDKVGITVQETNIYYESYANTVRNILSASDDTYDMIYLNEQNINSIAKDGYLFNLLELENLSLDEDWWLYEYNDLCKLNNELYFADGYANLLNVDTINIMLYNEDFADILKLDTPYQLVKDGSWTLDKFAEYMKAGADLNKGSEVPDSENIWNFDQPGNGAACSGMLVSAGENFFDIKDGQLTLTAGSERFYSVCDKLTKIMTENQSYMFFKELYGVSLVFKTNQALFSYGEIITTQQLRSADFSFGVLPNPKYDENQDRYYCRKSWPSAGVTIPKCVSDPEKSAAFADALNYLSREIVWPVYRGLVLEQKNLRNEESIEMLDIILRSSVPSLSTIYSVGSDMVDKIGAKLLKGDSDIASLIASSKTSIETALEKLNCEQ